jgi:hemerythrin-like domain-containing protein
MPDGELSAVLTHEHGEIDRGIESFIEKLNSGHVESEPLTLTLELLRRHIYLEETFLFPALREATGMTMPIFVMLREHGELWRTMDVLVDLLGESADLEALRDTCHRLLGQLEQHNSKEEPIIYPHADTDLPEQVGGELTRFIDSGRIPHGWVCQQTAAASSDANALLGNHVPG